MIMNDKLKSDLMKVEQGLITDEHTRNRILRDALRASIAEMMQFRVAQTGMLEKAELDVERAQKGIIDMRECLVNVSTTVAASIPQLKVLEELVTEHECLYGTDCCGDTLSNDGRIKP